MPAAGETVRTAYDADRAATALGGARLMTVVALVLIPFYAFCDAVVAPAELPWLRAGRAAAFGLAALGGLLLRGRIGRRWPMALGVLAVVAAGTQVEMRGADGAATGHYFAAAIVALLTAWLALPWGAALAAATTLTLVAAYTLGTVALLGVEDGIRLVPLGLMLATAGLVAGAAAIRERERWRDCVARFALQAHARRQEAIASIGQLGFRTRDAQVLLDRTAVWIAEALGLSHCGIWEVQADDKTLLLRAGFGWRPEVIGAATLDGRGRTHPALALRAAEPVVVEDLRTDKRLERLGVFRDHALVGGAAVVVRVRQRAYAVLTVYGATRAELGADEIEFLRAASRLIGSAIAGYADAQASKDDAAAAGALARAGRELLSSIDADVLLERLCQLTQDIVACDQSSTWLVRWERAALEPAAMVGVGAEAWRLVRDAPLPLDALSLLLARLGREEVVPVVREEVDAVVRDVLTVLGVHAALLVVLRREGEPVGLQLLGRTAAGATFSRQEERLAQGIVQLAGMALTNARLVQRLEAQGTPAGRSEAVASAGNGRMVSAASVDVPNGERSLAATRANVGRVRETVATTLPAPDRRRKRLLFADDLGMARLLLRRFIEREMPEIEVLEAFDGGQALAMVEAHRPDLVMLDLQMPGTDGYEAVRRIRALEGTRDLPIIATSINAGPRIEAAATAAGFTEFIAKPVSDYGPLKKRIEHWLGPTQHHLGPAAPAPTR